MMDMVPEDMMMFGGGAAVMPFPYSLDFSTLPDGPIPGWFTGGHFAVVTGKAYNTPTLISMIANGDFALWTGDNPNNWTPTAEDANNYVTEDPAGHVHLVSSSAMYISQALPAQTINKIKFYRYGFEITAYTSGTFRAFIDWTTTYLKTSTATLLWAQDIVRSWSNAAPKFYLHNSTAPADFVFTNAVFQEITDTMSLAQSTKSDLTVKLNSTPHATGLTGIVVRADSLTNPQNYLLAIINGRGGSGSLVLFKVVNGLPTSLKSDTNQGLPLELRCNGTTIELWSHNSQRYTGTVNEATINTNTIHGVFSTNGGNSLESFFSHELTVYKTVWIGGSNTTGSESTVFWVNYLWPYIDKICNLTVYRSGWGGIGTFHSLVRFAEVLTAVSPDVIFIDYAVNDASDYLLGTSRANGWAPAAEALIRKIRINLPNARIVFANLVQQDEWLSGDSYRTSRDKWISICEKYDVPYERIDLWLQGVIGTTTPTEAQCDVYGDGVHFTPTGHVEIANMFVPRLGEWYPHSSAGWSGDITDYDPPIFADVDDWMHDPSLRTGVDNDGETGTGWSTVSTTYRRSSTANDTISWTSECCAFGARSNYGAGAGSFAWSIDGGAETTVNLSSIGEVNQMGNFVRGTHTITLRVVSGTVEIREFWMV